MRLWFGCSLAVVLFGLILPAVGTSAAIEMEGCQAGRGVVPDHEVSYELEELLDGRDPYLTALEELTG